MNAEQAEVFTGYCRLCKAAKIRIKRGHWEFRWCERCDGSTG